MGLESVTTITDLVATNPLATDDRSQGDDHIRNLKTAVRSLLATANLTNLTQIGFPATAAGQAGKYLKVAAAENALEYGALGGAALLAVGTTAGTVAAGDDSRLVTNGNSHDHSGGDGAQIAYSGLSGVPMAHRCVVSTGLPGNNFNGTQYLYFVVETEDSANIHSAPGSHSRFTAPATGGYLLAVQLKTAYSARKTVDVYVNGSAYAYWFDQDNSGVICVTLSGVLRLTLNDYVEIVVGCYAGSAQYHYCDAQFVRLW